jgi:hypothetical protein
VIFQCWPATFARAELIMTFVSVSNTCSARFGAIAALLSRFAWLTGSFDPLPARSDVRADVDLLVGFLRGCWYGDDVHDAVKGLLGQDLAER